MVVFVGCWWIRMHVLECIRRMSRPTVVGRVGNPLPILIPVGRVESVAAIRNLIPYIPNDVIP